MNNDLISRSALKKWIEDSIKQFGGQYSTDMLNMFGLFEHIIDNAPTVEAVSLEHHNKIKGILDNEIKSLVDILDKERPQGVWKLDSIGTYCSICETHPDYATNFCPICGADMRKGGAE